MILAAGLGTRLRPITDNIPKALVKVDGIPIIGRLIDVLISQGFDYIVVNVHHHALKLREYLLSRDFGVEIRISDESEELLDTGGGLVKASPVLFEKNDDPVLVHNVDIISNSDLALLMNRKSEGPVLLVNDRNSSRKLIFDNANILRGWHDLKKDSYRSAGITLKKDYRELAFSGIYSITKSSVDEMRNLLGEGKFSVMDYFLHPERKLQIKGEEDGSLKLLDIGKPDTLAKVKEFLKEIEDPIRN